MNDLKRYIIDFCLLHHFGSVLLPNSRKKVLCEEEEPDTEGYRNDQENRDPAPFNETPVIRGRNRSGTPTRWSSRRSSSSHRGQYHQTEHDCDLFVQVMEKDSCLVDLPKYPARRKVSGINLNRNLQGKVGIVGVGSGTYCCPTTALRSIDVQVSLKGPSVILDHKTLLDLRPGCEFTKVQSLWPNLQNRRIGRELVPKMRHVLALIASSANRVA